MKNADIYERLNTIVDAQTEIREHVAGIREHLRGINGRIEKVEAKSEWVENKIYYAMGGATAISVAIGLGLKLLIG